MPKIAKDKTKPNLRKEQARKTKAKVLDTATKTFATRTFEDVQVAEIADAAGVALGIVYHYFTNKRQLYVESVRAMSTELFQVENLPDLAPYHRVRLQIKFILERLKSNPELFLGYVRNTTSLESDPKSLSEFGENEASLALWFAEVCSLESHIEETVRFIQILQPSLNKLFIDWLVSDCQKPVDTVVEAAVQMLAGALAAAQCYEPEMDIDTALNVLTKKPD